MFHKDPIVLFSSHQLSLKKYFQFQIISIYYYIWLSFEVYISFLGQLVYKWQVVKVGPKKGKVCKRCILPISQATIRISWLFLDLQLLYFWLPHPHGWALTAAGPKNSGKIQIITFELSKMHLFQTFLFAVLNLTTCHFKTSSPRKELYTSKESPT